MSRRQAPSWGYPRHETCPARREATRCELRPGHDGAHRGRPDVGSSRWEVWADGQTPVRARYAGRELLMASRSGRSLPALDRSEVQPLFKGEKPSTSTRRKTNRAVRDANPRCAAGPLIAVVDSGHVCFRFSTHTHHRRRHQGGGGGSFLASVNLVAVCEACHAWIHAHEADAERLELADGRSLYVSANYDHPDRPREYQLLGDRLTARQALRLAFLDAPEDHDVALDYLRRAGFDLTRRTEAA